MKRIRQRNRYVRRGSAVVEAAILAPLMMTAMLGMLEVGYAFMVKQTVVYASREGARAGALPGGEMADVSAAVESAMAGPNIDGYTVTSNIDTVSSTDTEVWVKVEVPFDRVSWKGDLLGGGTFEISATTTMRREGVDSGDGGVGVVPE